MQNQALLNEGEIYSQILEEGPFQLTTYHTNLPYVDKLISLQLFSPNDYPLIKKNLLNSKYPSQIILGIFENIPYDEDSLLKFINNPNFSLVNVYLSAYYIHLAFVTWIASRRPDELPPKSLVSAVTFISDSSMFGEAKDVLKISHSIFYFLFREYFASKKELIFDYTTFLVIFLSQNRNSSIEIYNLLLLAIPAVSERSVSSHIEDNFHDYILLCTSLDLPSSIASGFIQSIVYHISALDYNSLVLFQKLYPFLEKEDNITHFLELIPISIVDAIGALPPISLPEPIEPIVVDNTQGDNSLLQFLSYDSFPKGLNIEDVLEFSDSITMQDIVGVEFLRKIDVIISIMKNDEKTIPDFVTNFISCVQLQKSNSNILQLLGVVMYMATSIPQLFNVEAFNKILMHKLLFNPGITIYNNPENFSQLSMLRNYALKTFINRPDVLDNFLSENRIYPLLFAEIIYRFITIGANQIPPFIFTSSLIKAALFYRSFDNDNTRTALLSIFFSMHASFQQRNILVETFSNRFFSQEILVFLYEPKIRDFVLSNIRNFLVNGKETDCNMLHYLMNIIDITCPMFPDKQSVELVSDVLRTISEVMIHKWQVSKLFENLLFTLMKCGGKLGQGKENEEFLDNFIGYLTQITNIHFLTSPELNALENIVRNIFENEPPIKIFLKLVQVAASSALASQSTSVIIKQPKVLHIVLDLFKESPHFGEVVRFLGGLCQYSYKNCLALHIGEIDLKLIAILKSGLGDSLLSDIFTALNRISIVISSVTVMQRYISLLCPQNGIITQLNIDALRAITANMSLARRIPLVSMPFSNESTVTIKDVQTSFIEKSWALTIWTWYEPDSAQYKPRLILLQESEDKLISIAISSSSLVVNHLSDEFDTAATIDIQIQPRTWILLAIEYVYDENKDQFVMVASCNCHEPRKINLPLYEWKKKSVDVIIGGLPKDSISTNFASRFSGFSFMKTLSSEQLIAIYEAGPRSDPPQNENTILSARTTLQQNELAFIESEKNFGVTMQYSYRDKETMVSFSEILGQMCKVEFLLPLFSQLDCPINVPDVSYPALIIDVFSSTLSMSSEAQIYFADSFGFNVISHLLVTCDAKHINYELYLHFQAVLEAMQEDILIVQLLDAILLNLSVWSRADGISHTRIIKHWARAIYTSYSSQFHQLRPIKHLLTIMKLYCSNKIALAPNVNINDCLRAYKSIVTQMAMEFGVDNKTFLFMIGITVTPNSPTKEYLTILGELLQSKPCPFKDVTFNALSLLMLTFSFNDETIITMVFEILYLADQNNLFTDTSINDHINIILNQMTHDFCRESVFNSLLEMMLQGFYALLPILCWIAINLGSSAMTTLANKLQPNPEYCKDPNWFFWPIILIVQAPEPTHYLLFNFLILSHIESIAETIEDLYESIDAVADALNINATSDLKCKLLHTIADYLLNNVCGKNLIMAFFRLCEKFIFYDNDNRALQTLTQFSPFEVAANRRKRSLTTKEVPKQPFNVVNFRQTFGKTMWMTPSEVNNAIRNTNRKPSEEKVHVFSLRISADGGWTDANLAEKCLSLFQRWSAPEFLSFDLALCVFLAPFYYDCVKTHINRINLTQQSFSNNIPLLALLNQKCQENSHPVLFKLPGDSMIQASKALEEFVRTSELEPVKSSLLLLRTLQSHNLMIQQKSNKILSILDTNAVSGAANQERNYLFRLQKNRRDNERIWLRLWRCMTIDGAPWAIANEGKEKEKIALKRDNSLCSFGCPSRLKRDLPKNKNDDIVTRFQTETKNEYMCELVNPFSVSKAIISFSAINMYIRKAGGSVREWPIDSIKYVISHKQIRGKKALEFFFKDKKTKLFTLEDDNYEVVYNILKSNKLIATSMNVQIFTRLWQQRQISTFDYLMHLNRLSGRTFNDIEHYPVMPWLLTNFDTDEIELENGKYIRDLRKPVSQLGEDRLMQLMNQFKETGGEYYTLPGSQLRPADIADCLSRLPPFKCDHPCDSYEAIFKKSTEDLNCFSELPAEFYFLPEAFIENDDHTKNLKFPKWSNNNAFDFVYLSRKVLESEIVSKTIPRWIDMIWGTCQQGPQALSAFNIFHPDIYTEISDRKEGYSPSKLFGDSHPVRDVLQKKSYPVKNQVLMQIMSEAIVFVGLRKSKSSPNAYHMLTLDITGQITDSMVDFLQIAKHCNKDANSTTIIPKSKSKKITFSNFQHKNDSVNQLIKFKIAPEYSLNSLSTAALQNDKIISSYSFDKLNDIDRSASFGMLSSQSNNNMRRLSFSPTNGTMTCPSAPYFMIPDFNRVLPSPKKRDGKFIEMNDCQTIALVDAGNVNLITNGKLETMKTNINDVTYIAGNKSWFVTANRGSVLTFYKQDNSLTTDMKFMFNIPLYRDSITCVSLSKSFGLAAAGTRDGFLFFISLSRGTIFATVDLGDSSRPLKMLVTHHWGFVLVYMTELQKGQLNHVIALYSPNGNMIRKRSIASAISSWSCFKTPSGFDYVVAADDKGRIYKFEAFYLNIDEHIYRCSCEVPFVEYLPEQGGIIAVTTDGRIIFAPCCK